MKRICEYKYPESTIHCENEAKWEIKNQGEPTVYACTIHSPLMIKPRAKYERIPDDRGFFAKHFFPQKGE